MEKGFDIDPMAEYGYGRFFFFMHENVGTHLYRAYLQSDMFGRRSKLVALELMNLSELMMSGDMKKEMTAYDSFIKRLAYNTRQGSPAEIREIFRRYFLPPPFEKDTWSDDMGRFVEYRNFLLNGWHEAFREPWKKLIYTFEKIRDLEQERVYTVI